MAGMAIRFYYRRCCLSHDFTLLSCMKKTQIQFLFFLFVLIICSAIDLFAQCAMCNETARTATQDHQENAIALNNGILYLMAIPYVMLTAIGLLWWKYRKQKKN